jgi:hypothetical protein
MRGNAIGEANSPAQYKPVRQNPEYRNPCLAGRQANLETQRSSAAWQANSNFVLQIDTKSAQE